MILAWLIIVPVFGGVLAWLAGRANAVWSRWVALMVTSVEMALALVLWTRSPGQLTFVGRGWLAELNGSWIPQFGIRFHLAMDGISLLLVLLTAFLGILSVLCSWREIRDRVGFFHLNMLLVLAGTVGVFLAMDLFLFYFAWELMVVPMYFLIAIWGGERRRYAATRFFIFTQVSGLLMLLSILGLYFVHGRNTGTYTFDYAALLGTNMSASTAAWLFLGFAAAFLVKLPAVPLHSWLPDAYTTSPTAGSVLLAGLLSKTGAYGLLRFAVPFFPGAAREFSTVAMALAVIGILYGAALAFAQTDLKRLIAYSSISHLGFVLLGIFAWNQLALQGVMMQMICHGVGTAGLFILAGALEERTQTRDLGKLGGLWQTMPRMGGAAMVLALAALGMPGLGNFVGEFLVLLGTYRASVAFTAVGAAGFVGSVIYALWLVQQAFHGRRYAEYRLPDLQLRETTMMASMILVLLWLGLYPQPVLDRAGKALEAVRQEAVGMGAGRQGRAEHDAALLAFGGNAKCKMQNVESGIVCEGRPVPEGQTDNSPTLQRWVEPQERASPEGTTDWTVDGSGFSRPFGTPFHRHRNPNAEALGYCRMSLRDHRCPVKPLESPEGISFSVATRSACNSSEKGRGV